MGLEDLDIFNPAASGGETESEAALAGYLDEARKIIERAEAAEDTPAAAGPLTGEAESLRWFPLPGEFLK